MNSFAGFDVGSRSIELVVLRGSEVAHRAMLPTTHNPLAQVQALRLQASRIDSACATGYGRKLVAQELGCEAVSEITAYARGASYILPDACSVIDIGGQDTKIIALGKGGLVTRFEMNDRCAAGTGKFLEVMALSFQLPITEFGAYAANGKPGITINNMCTVFAESEVTSLVARGAESQDVAYAIHESIVKRTLAMYSRVRAQAPVIFAGGVAHNDCVVRLLAERIEGELVVPEYPEYAGALGAALIAKDNSERDS